MSPSTPPPPQTFGRYELAEYLGGGMSAVYRARDTLMGRSVALKILKDAQLDQATTQRFLLEAQIAGNLNHENVVRTYDFGFDPDGRPYMVLEYLEGENLADAIKGGRTGSLAHRARIGAELAGAIEYVHPRNVVHRDLKPANIFLASAVAAMTGPLVKLMDFGISRVENVSITQAGMTLGTPGYMAPEQIRGEPVTKSVDIYAFGVVLWELFTDERAFAAPALDRVFYMVMHDELSLDKLRAAGVPAELVQQIGKCVSKEAWRRPENLSGIRRELLLLANPGQTSTGLEDTVTKAMPAVAPAPVAAPAAALAPPPVAANRRWLAVGAGVMAGLGLVLAAVMMISGGSARHEEKKGDTSVTTLAQRIEMPSGAMLIVPAGSFRFGETKETVELPAFYVDRTEVSNRAFAEFARATGAALPPGFAAAQPDLPVVNVTLDEAGAFATWAGKSLPTSKQWEKAARGLDGRTFPWGEAAEASRANVGKGKSGGLAPVDGFADGASPFQALQMVGNAWEWVDETVAPSPADLATFGPQLKPPPASGDRWVRIRGGSFIEPLDAKVMSESVVVPARFRNAFVGFRCVKTIRE